MTARGETVSAGEHPHCLDLIRIEEYDSFFNKRDSVSRSKKPDITECAEQSVTVDTYLKMLRIHTESEPTGEKTDHGSVTRFKQDFEREAQNAAIISLNKNLAKYEGGKTALFFKTP